MTILRHLLPQKLIKMKFSEAFQIQLLGDEEWFDPILNRDTKLFLDPFLVFKSTDILFAPCHDKIIRFFNEAFVTGAKSTKSTKDVRYRNLLHSMNFPEVSEICLGYSIKSTKGAGSGSGYARKIVDAIYDSIDAGIESINHFEELGILNEGIGCDRISDITSKLILPELITYTQQVCEGYNVSMYPYTFEKGFFDYEFRRWEPLNVLVPKNPYTDNGVVLVPKSFLRDLPTIDPNDFYDYCWVNKNEELRDQFSLHVKKKLSKSAIVHIARRNREWVREYSERKEASIPRPYGLASDKKGLYKWYDEALHFALQNPLRIPEPLNAEDFKNVVEQIIDQFEHYVENHLGYKLLWNDDKTPKSEEAVQSLFTGTVQHYCRANNIDLSREHNLGRGPVDFKFSQGYLNRTCIEVKKANNSRFWKGLKSQLTKYMEVEQVDFGYFIVLCYNDKDLKKVNGIEAIARSIEKQTKMKIKVCTIDASLDKPAASRI